MSNTNTGNADGEAESERTERGSGVGIATELDFREIVEALGDPVVITGADGVIRYVNQAFEDLLGWSADELIGRSVAVLQPARLRDRTLEGLRLFAQQDTTRTSGSPVRMPMMKRDGTEIEVDGVASLRTGRTGERMAIVSFRDLRERVELERERSLSRYLRATADAAARITSRLDFEFVLRTVSTTLIDEMGAELAQVWLVAPGTDMLYLRMQSGAASADLPDEIHWAALPVWLHGAVGEAVPRIFPVSPDDSRFDPRWRGNHGITNVVTLPLPIAETSRGVIICGFRHQISNEIVAVLQSFAAIVATSLNDVQYFVREQEARTEAERAERDFAFLAEASRRLAASLDYETTLQSAAELAVPYLADWCVVDIAESRHGIRRVHVAHRSPEKDPIAVKIAWHSPLAEEDSEVAAVMQGGEPILVSAVDEAYIRGTGFDPVYQDVLLLMGITSYMRVPMVMRGRVYAVLTLVSSAPARHYTHLDLALAEDFARRAAAAVDNAGLYTELQATVRLRDEFLSTVSHDLKNPIAAVKGRAQMLRRRVDRVPTEERTRFIDGLDAINSTADRMVRLISDLVDVARLRSGAAIELRRSLVDLVEIARRVTEEHQESTPDHVIVVRATEEPVMGRWDGDRLERVVDNLVSNAVKYSPDGGPITVAIAPEDEGVRVAVIDRGVGIPADELPRVFDRFFRASNVGDSIPGSGIGLAGAQQIVQQHGGTIAVSSREGEGSTFTVWLPREDPG